MEDNLTIIITKWATIKQKMVTQTVDTPQGPMQVQQAVQVPIVFRDADEIKRYIDEKYKHINTIFELIENNVDTLEVIALGTSSVKKVLQEEAYLKEALENYKF